MTQQPVISYGISRVHYAHGHIDKVKGYQLNGATIGSPKEREWSRDEVVNRIRNGESFVTLPRLNTSKVRRGQTVDEGQTIEVLMCIRSIPNRKHSDNLDRLPEY